MFSARSASAVRDAPAVPVPVQTATSSRPYIPPLEDTFDNAWEYARLTAPQESPHLSRAASGSIIAIALAAILGALIYNFRQDIGGTVIQLGQSISGENRSAASAPAQETKPDAAPSEQQNAEQKPADSDLPAGSVPENSAGSAKPNVTSPNANGAVGTPASGKNSISGSGSAQNSESSTPSSTAPSTPSSSTASSAKPSVNPVAQFPLDGNGKKATLPATSSGISSGIPAATSGDAGSGQEEFKAAEDILRGSNRRRDLPVAVSLLWSGVRKGYVPAEVALADLFRRGEGVPRNCDQARVLLVAASKRGSFDARLMLEKLAEQGCE
jgi:TPR repeat protein